LSKERFEEAFKKLEAIVNKMEGGDLSLDESLKLFEEGMRLSKLCSQKLTEVQKKVELLIKSEDGSLKTQPFPLDEEEE
jgi:exodeoxyribonuclease VII small subunit